jgi:SLOG in TRPM, prokaryote
MFGLTDTHPILLLNGKASKWTTEEHRASLWPFFTELALAITNVDINYGPIVMTGATRYGIIQMFGEACEHIERYPKALIGITPQYFVDEEQIKLEEHHSHIVLTSGNNWEEAIPMMKYIRNLIANNKPAVLLAIDGGENTLKEMLAHFSQIS